MSATKGEIRPTDAPIKRALLSVSDKAGLVDLARGLAAHGVELLSTGGTAKAIRDAGLAVIEVADYTGFPEMLDGRVKTLHPKIHGGLLGRRDLDEHVGAMKQHGIGNIDLVCVNLYPFAQVTARGCTMDEAIENIDIGGPSMLRSAAKNHAAVTVLVDPADYAVVLDEMKQHGGSTTFATRQRLAKKVYRTTAAYDGMIADYLGNLARTEDEPFGETLHLPLTRAAHLRYGENPHQVAAFYAAADAQGASIGSASQLQGKELSFNNLADADTAFECVRAFESPACVIVKHANPCGVAVAVDIGQAYDRAYRTDPTSAFGGIIAFNRALDGATARTILERQFVEVIIAPSADAEAREACAKKENVRLLVTGGLGASNSRFELRSVNGGLLVQSRDLGVVAAADFKVVTRRAPTAAELADLDFAWRVCKYVKSNAIVYAKGGMTVGIGAGQMSRVVSSRIAAMKARDEGLDPSGSVMASDAFFPFRDGLDAAVEHGISAVVQPGGSKRDSEVVAAADEHGIAMVFTGMRHFRH